MLNISHYFKIVNSYFDDAVAEQSSRLRKLIQPKVLSRATITTIQPARKNNKQQKLKPQIPAATQETF